MLSVVSGGQSGVDRAALDAARRLGLRYAGWCPKGGWAEDLTEPPGLLAHYPNLRETPLADPAQRTAWNVRDSDATLVLTGRQGSAVSPGTRLAETLAARYGRPLLCIPMEGADAPETVREWLASLRAGHAGPAPFRLGIGGPRASEAPGIYGQALSFVTALLR